MLKKLRIFAVFASLLALSAWGGFDEDVQSAQNAIRNKDARQLSVTLFGSDLTYIKQLDYFSTFSYAFDSDEIHRLLHQRNFEGESAISLSEEYPHVIVSRLLRFAHRVVDAHASLKWGEELKKAEVIAESDSKGE